MHAIDFFFLSSVQDIVQSCYFIFWMVSIYILYHNLLYGLFGMLLLAWLMCFQRFISWLSCSGHITGFLLSLASKGFGTTLSVCSIMSFQLLWGVIMPVVEGLAISSSWHFNDLRGGTLHSEQPSVSIPSPKDPKTFYFRQYRILSFLYFLIFIYLYLLQYLGWLMTLSITLATQVMRHWCQKLLILTPSNSLQIQIYIVEPQVTCFVTDHLLSCLWTWP